MQDLNNWKYVGRIADHLADRRRVEPFEQIEKRHWKNPLLQVVGGPTAHEDDDGPECDADPACHARLKGGDRVVVPPIDGFIGRGMEIQGVHSEEEKEYEFDPVAVTGIQPRGFGPKEQAPAEEHDKETPQA